MSGARQWDGTSSRTVGEEYTVRWFQPGDADEVHRFVASELHRKNPTEWFDWKYVDAPYLSHVPFTLAEHGDEIVGVHGYAPAPLRAGDRVRLALQPVDAFVDPSHRQQGIFTALVRQGLDRYREESPALFFNTPTDGALRVHRKLGWELLGDLAVYYRVQRPSALDVLDVDGAPGQLIDHAYDAVARGSLAVLDATAPSASEIDVTRHEELPVETLASLYETSVPDRLHICREPRYYEWWLDDPNADYAAYVARVDGTPVGAVVTRQATRNVLQIRDAVPLGSARSRSVFGTLLAAVVTDNADVPVVKTAGATLPGGLLKRFGFVRDSLPVLESVSSSFYVACRSLDDGRSEEVFPGDATDRSNWRFTFLEMNRD